MLGKLIAKFKKLRKGYYKKMVMKTAARVEGPIYVNGLTYVNKQTTLGKNVHFNGLRIVGNGHVSIGNNFHSGIDCVIIPNNHNYQGATLPYDNTFMEKRVVIEDNVWLGHGVIILGGVTLGEGCIIQAGAVVVKSIPRLGIAGGNPAKVFKYRDAEHYDTLKAQNKFI